MLQTIAVAVGSLLAVIAALLVGFTVAFRTRFGPFLRAIRRFNRDVTNKRQLQGSAGQPGAYASVVCHVGRRTGTTYQTPVVAVAADEDLVFALPYGRGADWVRNVLAAGGAVIEHEGETIAVTAPRLVTADEANPHFSTGEQRMHRLYGVTDFLVVQRVPAGGNGQAARTASPG